jgi:ribonuclease HI
MKSKKMLDRFLKDKQNNAVKKITASYLLDFKKCFIQIKKTDGSMDGQILENTSNGYTKDFNNFLFSYLKNNTLSDSFELVIDTTLSKNTALNNHLTNKNIVVNNFRSKKDLALFQDYGKYLIQDQRKTLLKHLTNYEENVMLYTDGSQKGKKCGMACIIDHHQSEKTIKLTQSMRCDNENYNDFEIDAISLGLNYIMDHEDFNGKKIIVTTDSDKANDICLNIKNKPYFQQMYPDFYETMLKIKFNLEINLIKSHVERLNNENNIDFKYNSEADELARDAALKCKKKMISYNIDI